MGARHTRAAGKRDARNKARREQRAKARADKKALQTPPAAPEGLIDEYVAQQDGAEPATTAASSGACSDTPTRGWQDRVGQIHGRPMMDPDLRLGRRSVEQPWDAKRVYDVRIVRATDNAVTMVKGLSLERAESLMTDAVFSIGSDLVSIERTPRVEY